MVAMKLSEKTKAVRDVLLSNPRNAGPEYEVFRAALRDSLDKPDRPEIIDELHEALPRT